MMINAPKTNVKAGFFPLARLTLAAVKLISPGGETPTIAAMNPKRKGKTNDMNLFYFETNIRNCFVYF